jgi:prevent-host-death family protein
MERTITQRELRNDNAEIMRELESGVSFLITRNGVPVGRLSPVPRRTFVPTKELVEGMRFLPKIDYATLRAELDAVVDQDPQPRV